MRIPPFHKLPQFLALAMLAIAALPAYGGKDAGEDCADCGFRRPGQRSRDLAMLVTPLMEAANAMDDESARAPASDIDFSAAARLPIRIRPNTQQAIHMSESDPLLGELNTDKATFYRLRFMIPEKFRLAQGPAFQKALDVALLNIGASEAGKQVMCLFAVDNEKNLQSYFGMSASAAKTVRSGCAGRKFSDVQVGSMRRLTETYPNHMFATLLPKKFVFLFSESGRPQIEGYTTRNNTTFLTLSKETMTSEDLTRMVAHELAISYDQLARLGYLNNVTTIEDQGVNLAFGLDNGQYAFKEQSHDEFIKMRCAFRDPALRYAAATQRAFNFEDAVAAGNSPNMATTGSCSEILAKNSVLLQAMARTVSWDTGWYAAGCGLAKEPAARVKQILARIKTIEGSRLQCARKEACGGRSEMSLCDLLLKPRVGPNALDLDGGGPRPSMGGGWGEYISSDQDLIIRAEMGGSLTPEDIKHLGERLNFPNITDLDREEGLR